MRMAPKQRRRDQWLIPENHMTTIEHRLLTLIALAAVAAAPLTAQPVHRVASPDGRNVVEVGIREGRLYYAVQRAGRNIILPSMLEIGRASCRENLKMR